MRHFLILVALLPVFASAQRVEWRDEVLERTQTLSFDLAFGEELTLITPIQAADLEMRALATHSQELVDGTVMAAILRTQPQVRIANAGGDFVEWSTDVRQFQKLGLIETGDFAITIAMPAVPGADFVPNLKLELILSPITPESQQTFLDASTRSEEVLGAEDYGLANLIGQTLYPNLDMSQIVFLRDASDAPGLSPSIGREPGLCTAPTALRTIFARLEDMQPTLLADLSNFPQECWAPQTGGLRAGQIADQEGYQPDLRIRLGEDSGDMIGFVHGPVGNPGARVFIRNTAEGWFYGPGDGAWEVVRNGTRVDIPFGDGILAIRNPRGGETPDATESDAFVSYLVE